MTPEGQGLLIFMFDKAGRKKPKKYSKDRILLDHQSKQIETINEIENKINSNNPLGFSTVAPVADYVDDSRICLTSVHLPDSSLLSQVNRILIDPLKKIAPGLHYYPPKSLHLTIKNIRVINDPPNFDDDDVAKAVEVFSKIIPRHRPFSVYFYRLLLFPNNLALIGTTDPELDYIIADLDRALSRQGIPDDKKYINSKYFFCNMTLARFNERPSEALINQVKKLSDAIVVNFKPYLVDSVTLLSCNAVFEKRRIRGRWPL